MIFLRLIKMIIAPLVFSTLVVGIGHMSDAGAVGRVGGKAMLWFVSASLVSLTLGLILVNLFEPGVGVHKVASGVSSGIDAHAMTLDGFVKHVFPDSAIRPMVDNEILQIVVFSIFFGVACAAMGERAKSGARGHRGPVAHHPARHRLCDEAGAARGVLRDGGDDRDQRSGDSRQLRQVHGPVLLRPRCAFGSC